MDHDDERLRALFTTVGTQPGPPLGFTADAIARRGRRVRLARWGAGVAAGLAVVAAVTTTVALSANRDVEPGNPAPVTTTDVPTTDVPTTTPTYTPTYTTTESPATTT